MRQLPGREQPMASTSTVAKGLLTRKDDRVIIHFVCLDPFTAPEAMSWLTLKDYDCFYAAVVESEDPSLRSKPLAIQQKQIIVTCNYE